MTGNDNLFGRTIGEFVLGEPLDEGGFGRVYRCKQPTLGREAVIKVLHRQLISHDTQLQRFLREAQLASRLDHPYAAHIYAFGVEEQDGLLWIAMEFVQGVTLKHWLRDHGPMPLPQFVPFFELVAEVVQTAHQRGIVHRDLKPSNVMVIERAGRLLPKLLDFGVAKLLDGELFPESTQDTVKRMRALVAEKVPEEVLKEFRVGASTVTDDSPSQRGGQSRLTPDGAAIGTPAYMAPEQLNRADSVGPAADLYALAVVAFEALTGRRPFEGMSLIERVERRCAGEVPPLGRGFPQALDQVFPRALAECPEDRWRTALELAGALRAASGIGTTRTDLPRIDQDVRDAWLAEAPQPLAEALAELGDAHNAHQARDIIEELIGSLLRYLLAVALVAHTRVREGQDDPALLKLVRALNRRELGTEERVRLLRLLVRPLASRPGAHPIPELVALATPGSGGTDDLEPLLRHTATEHTVTEDAVRWQLVRLIADLTQLLRKARFVLDYVLVVPRDGAAERWAGRRRQPRMTATVSAGEIIDGHPMLLDCTGRVCLDLWPLAQAVPLTEGAEPELFLFDGHAHHDTLLLAAPSDLEHHDSVARDWLAAHVIAEIEIKTRMREQIRVAAQQWQDRTRPEGLLWRGDALVDLEHWMRHTTGAVSLGAIEKSFVAASRRVARRARWRWRLLVAVGVGAVLAGFAYRAALHTQVAHDLAEKSVTQAEFEQGRQSLLHNESIEAQLHLAEAYQRGDHSWSLEFMLARALQPLRSEVARFVSTRGRMWSVAFSPDGHRIVTTDDKAAQIWDAQTNRLVFTLPHGDTVYHAVYSADGTRLATAGNDGAVRIWDATGGTLLHELRQQRSDGKQSAYFVVAMSPDGQLVAAIDTMGEVAHVWDASTGAALAALRNDASEWPSLAFSADGRWLASSGGDDVRVFDTKAWAHVLTLNGARVRSLSFDPTGLRLATGTAGGDAAIWAIPSGARVYHLREIGEPIDAIAFAPNGEYVVTAGRDGAEQVWNARSGALQSQGSYLRDKILSIEFDPTSKLVVAAGASGTVVVVDAALGTSVAVLEGPRSLVRVAHFDSSSRRVVGASWDGTARIWDATSPYRRWSSPPISDDCGLVGILEPDRRFVAIGCRNHDTRVWDTSSGQLVAELPSVTQVDGDFTSAFPAVSAAGDRAAIARGNAVAIYELPGARLLRTVTHPAAVNAVAFASTGHDLVSGATDGSLLVTLDGRDPIALPVSPGGIDAAALLSDGRVVATDARSRLRVYASDRNTVLADLAVPTRVSLLRLSPDGRTLITIPSYVGRTAPPVLWDLEHYRLIAELEGHVGRVYSARFVGGGHDIVTAGGDGTARLWDGATGELHQIYRGSSRFLDAVLDPDASMVVAGSGDGLLRFWDAASGRMIWTLQAHKSYVIGIRFEGGDIVTRGFAGDLSRWKLPSPKEVIAACDTQKVASADRDACAIVSR